MLMFTGKCVSFSGEGVSSTETDFDLDGDFLGDVDFFVYGDFLGESDFFGRTADSFISCICCSLSGDFETFYVCLTGDLDKDFTGGLDRDFLGETFGFFFS
jgi:hypothetical protein